MAADVLQERFGCLDILHDFYKLILLHLLQSIDFQLHLLLHLPSLLHSSLYFCFLLN